MSGLQQKRACYGEKGLRLVRSWRVLMLLAEAQESLPVQQIHCRLHEDPDFALDPCNVATIREDLKTLVRAGFPVQMVDQKGRDITEALFEGGRGHVKNVHWQLNQPVQVGRLTSPRHSLPTAADVLNLSLCRSLLTQEVPRDYPLFSMMKKMLEDLHCRMNRQLRLGEPPLQDLQGRVQILGKRYLGSTAAKANWDQLVRAIARRQVLKGHYRNRQEAQPKAVDIAPFAVWFDEQRGYVLAAGGTDHKIRSWRIDRFELLSVATGVEPPEISELEVETILRQSLRGHIGKPVEIRLTVKPEIAYLFEEYEYHPSQTIATLVDGSKEVKLFCPVTWAVEEWVLGFGEYVRVESPRFLKDNFKKRLTRCLDQYTD